MLVALLCALAVAAPPPPCDPTLPAEPVAVPADGPLPEVPVGKVQLDVPETAPAARLVEAARALGHWRCVRVAADEELVLDVVDDVPGSPEVAAQAPLVVWREGDVHLLSIWPQDAVAVPAAEPEVLAALLVAARRLRPTERTVVLHLADGARAEDGRALMRAVARAGYTHALLHVGAATWAPTWTPPADPVRYRRLRVQLADRVVVGPDGGFDIEPHAVGAARVSLRYEDVEAFQWSRQGDYWSLVLVTATARWYVASRTALPEDDLLARWVLGRPVIPYTGRPLNDWYAPTVIGTFAPLAVVPYALAAQEGARRDRLVTRGAADKASVTAILDRQKELVRPCFDRLTKLRRAFPRFYAAPYGTVRVALYVRADGTVRWVEVIDTDVESRKLLACTEEMFMATRMPRALDGRETRVEYSFGFHLR